MWFQLRFTTQKAMLLFCSDNTSYHYITVLFLEKNTWNLCFLILYRLESRVKPPHIILLYIYEKWTEIWQFMVKITFRSIVCWQLLIFFVFLLLREILIMWVAPCNPFLFGVKIRMYTEILRASSPRNPFEA